MKKCLLTAFKGKGNSSFQLVDPIQTEKLYLTNSFQGVGRDVASVEDEFQKIVMFGLDKKLKNAIRFEKTAEKDGDLAVTSADLHEYVALAQERHIGYTVSETPTQYLCNEAYYRMMQKVRCPVLFIHIPTMKNMTGDFFEKLVSFAHALTI